MDFDLQKLYERRNEVQSIVWICTLSYNSGIFSLYPIFQENYRFSKCLIFVQGLVSEAQADSSRTSQLSLF